MFSERDMIGQWVYGTINCIRMWTEVTELLYLQYLRTFEQYMTGSQRASHWNMEADGR